jgi:hypothetical protein
LPIDKSEFSKGTPIRSLKSQVLRFLSKNPDRAYTTVEIVRDLIRPDEKTPADIQRFGGYLASVAAALDILVEEDKIVGRIIQTSSVRDVYFAVT